MSDLQLAPLRPSRLVVRDGTCSCGAPVARSAADPARRLSSHSTSGGYVVYFRCECGRPRLATMVWAPTAGVPG